MIKILIICSLLFCYSASASIYYIDYGSGIDSNVGNATNAAWKHCPGDPLATSHPSTTSLSAGDIVYFKAGSIYFMAYTNSPGIGQYGFGISVGWNGSATNHITYATLNEWGNGNRVLFTDFYGSNAPVGYTGKTAFYDSNFFGFGGITFSNLEFGYIGGSSNLPADPGHAIAQRPGLGIGSLHPLGDILVTGCYFHDFGYNFATKPMDGDSVDGSAGVSSTGSSGGGQNIIISNNVFQNIGKPIAFNWTTSASGFNNNFTNIIICSNVLHGWIHWAMWLGGEGGGTMDNVNIYGNTIYDFDWQYSDWDGYGQTPHQDGIFIARTAQGGLTGTNIWIHHNHFTTTTTAFTGGATGLIFLSGASSANIYDNIGNDPNGTPFVTVNNDVTGDPADFSSVVIFNNTAVVDGGACIDEGAWSPFVINWQTNIHLASFNNIFYNQNGSQAGSIYTLGVTNFLPITQIKSDYNLYYQTVPSTGNPGLWNIALATPPHNNAVWADLQANQYELNGLNTNPSLIDISHIGPNIFLNNLSVATNSPALFAGTNLSSLISLMPMSSIDYSNVMRPSTGNWTIGAFQLSSQIIPPVSPLIPGLYILH